MVFDGLCNKVTYRHQHGAARLDLSDERQHCSNDSLDKFNESVWKHVDQEIDGCIQDQIEGCAKWRKGSLQSLTQAIKNLNQAFECDTQPFKQETPARFDERANF